MKLHLNLATELDTKALANKISRYFLNNRGLCLYLHGGVGAGKTTFTRFLIQALNYKEHIKSPTYTIVEEYMISVNHCIQHLDLYRIDSPKLWIELGLYEWDTSFINRIIEWPNKACPYIDPPDLELFINIYDTGRVIDILSKTNIGYQIITHIKENHE